MTLIRFHNRPGMRDSFEQFALNPSSRNCSKCNPPANIFEKDNDFVVELAVPGYLKEDFRINVEQQVLSVSADEKPHEAGSDNFLRREFGVYEISKRFILPKTVDTENIKADYQNGILRIYIPVKKEAKISREISIS